MPFGAIAQWTQLKWNWIQWTLSNIHHPSSYLYIYTYIFRIFSIVCSKILYYIGKSYLFFLKTLLGIPWYYENMIDNTLMSKCTLDINISSSSHSLSFSCLCSLNWLLSSVFYLASCIWFYFWVPAKLYLVLMQHLNNLIKVIRVSRWQHRGHGSGGKFMF